jgi:cytochrome c551/c552
MRNKAIVMSAADYAAWYGSAGSTAPPAAGGSGAAATFTSSGCSACHTFKAIPGAVGVVGPSLDKLKAAAATAHEDLTTFIKESIVDPNKYIAPGYQPGVMPPNFGQSIPADKLDQLVQYLAEHTSG